MGVLKPVAVCIRNEKKMKEKGGRRMKELSVCYPWPQFQSSVMLWTRQYGSLPSGVDLVVRLNPPALYLLPGENSVHNSRNAPRHSHERITRLNLYCNSDQDSEEYMGHSTNATLDDLLARECCHTFSFRL